MVTIDQVAVTAGVSYGVAAKWLREPFSLSATIAPATAKGGHTKFFALADVVPRVRDHLNHRGVPGTEITQIIHSIIKEGRKND